MTGNADVAVEFDPVTIVEVDWNDRRAAELRGVMDEEIEPRYADLRDADPTEYERRGRLMAIAPGAVAVTILAIVDHVAVGHAALRRHGDDWELKRLITRPEFRGRGISRALVAHIEDAARGYGADRIVLQTGNRQVEAIRLYERLGYARIPVFPPYDEIPVSVCFEKRLH